MEYSVDEIVVDFDFEEMDEEVEWENPFDSPLIWFPEL